jgi:predicted nuclease with TOPRIM domain
MSSPEQLSDLLRRHGVDNDELLDALKWKYRKIYTEKEMVLRERDKLRAADEAIAPYIQELIKENDRLRAELKLLKGDKWEEAGQ